MFSDTGLEPSGVFASSFLISASTSVSYFNATSISMLPSASTAMGFERSCSVFALSVADEAVLPELSPFPDAVLSLQAVTDSIIDTAKIAASVFFIEKILSF